MITPRKHPAAETDAESKIPVPSGYKDSIRYPTRGAGMGYGQSSGYARKRRYAEDATKDLFRLG